MWIGVIIIANLDAYEHVLFTIDQVHRLAISAIEYDVIVFTDINGRILTNQNTDDEKN